MLERAVKQSLANLRVSDVNLLLIHWPNPQIPLADTMGAMCEMKKKGFARHIGISNFTVKLIDEAVKLSSEPIVTNQIEWHPYLDEEKVRAACAKHGISVTAYCPIARGRAVGDESADARRQEVRQVSRPGIAALARSEGCDRHPAHLEGRAADREHVDLRFRAVAAGYGRGRCAGETRRARGQRRLGAELGLKLWC